MRTKAKPQKQAEKAAPPARNTKTSPEGDDVYELCSRNSRPAA